MAHASAQSDEIGHAMVRVVGLCPPGTFVRLDNDDLAVVVRRSNAANQPFVVIVGRASGELLPTPRLHSTATSDPRIRTALAEAELEYNEQHVSTSTFFLLLPLFCISFGTGIRCRRQKISRFSRRGSFV